MAQVDPKNQNLTFNPLDFNSSRRYFKIMFPRKQRVAVHATCLFRGELAYANLCFLKSKKSITNLSSAEFAQRALKVKQEDHDGPISLT